MELYSCAIEEETILVNTPKKLAKKLRSSFGRAPGRKLCPLLEAGDPDAFLQSNPIPLYVSCTVKAQSFPWSGTTLGADYM